MAGVGLTLAAAEPTLRKDRRFLIAIDLLPFVGLAETLRTETSLFKRKNIKRKTLSGPPDKALWARREGTRGSAGSETVISGAQGRPPGARTSEARGLQQASSGRLTAQIPAPARGSGPRGTPGRAAPGLQEKAWIRKDGGEQRAFGRRRCYLIVCVIGELRRKASLSVFTADLDLNVHTIKARGECQEWGWLSTVGPRGPAKERATEPRRPPQSSALRLRAGGVTGSLRLGCPEPEPLGWEGVWLVPDRGLEMQTDSERETEADSMTETQICASTDAVGGGLPVSALRKACVPSFLWALGALCAGRHLPPWLCFCSGLSFWFAL
nr:PREDICTED: uncharacterized protein LOC103549922 [Equus przewalskii]